MKEVGAPIGTGTAIILVHHHDRTLVLVLGHVLGLGLGLGLVLGLGLGLGHVLVLDHVAMMVGTEGRFLLEDHVHPKIPSPHGNLAAQKGLILVHEEAVAGVAGGKVASVTVIMILGREIWMREDIVTGLERYVIVS